jgi:hypothetical protein
MYRDKRGLVTTGAGNLIDPAHEAFGLTWLRADESIASTEEIAAEWARVHAMPPALLWTHYQSPSGLHLADLEIRRIVADRLQANVRLLIARWPALPSWPWQAQAAACSLAWAVGAGAVEAGLTGPGWPHHSAALDRQDWRAAAEAGQLRSADNPGVVPRNLSVRALYLLAGGGSWDEAVEGWHGPTADAALRALGGLGVPS